MQMTGTYDGIFQMFVEEPRQPDLRHLAFMRWLAERGRLEHDAISPPHGEYASSVERSNRCGRAWEERGACTRITSSPYR
jgi:hypothetical protein